MIAQRRQHSEETKAKIRLALLGQASPFKGKRHTPEAIEKMRSTWFQTGAPHPSQRPAARERARGMALERAKGAPSKLEALAKECLKELGLVFLEQYVPSDCPRFAFDFAIPARRILIEVDGCYWHGCKSCGEPGLASNHKADKSKNTWCSKRGIRLIRLRGCDSKRFVQLLSEALS